MADFEKQLRKLVEPGVLDVVLLLNRAGVFTSSSCDGGRGHQSKRPMVSCQPGSDDMERTRKLLTRVLLKAGYRRFSVQTSYFYEDSTVDGAFLEVEFFDRKPVKPVAASRARQ
jgi:hypothetical protein